MTADPSPSNLYAVASRHLTELNKAVTDLMADKLQPQIENQQLREALDRKERP